MYFLQDFFESHRVCQTHTVLVLLVADFTDISIIFLRSLGFSFCFVCTYKEHFIESFLRVFQPGRNFKGKMNKWVRVLTNLSILFSGASRFMTTCIFEDRFFGLHTHFRRNKERTSKVTLSPAGYLLADVWIL
jgi:hypothetical protein